MTSTFSVEDTNIDPTARLHQSKEIVQDKSHTENDEHLQSSTFSEEDGQFQYEDDEMPPGCISVKDFAYTLEDPLHYGFYSDIEEYEEEEEEAYGEENDEYDEHDPNSVLEEYYNDDDEDDEANYYEGHDQDEYSEDFDRRKSYIMPAEHIINRKAIALYDFENENENELGLHEGQVVFIDYRHGQGWLVVETIDGMHTGLVPEDYLQILDETEDGQADQDQDQEPGHNGYANEYAHTNTNDAAASNTHDGVQEDSAKRPDYLAGLFDVEQETGRLPHEENGLSSNTTANDPLNESMKTLSIQ
ncbi:hypothetical protein ACO0QE_002700 [Hanseniaspora vineae]